MVILIKSGDAEGEMTLLYTLKIEHVTAVARIYSQPCL